MGEDGADESADEAVDWPRRMLVAVFGRRLAETEEGPAAASPSVGGGEERPDDEASEEPPSPDEEGRKGFAAGFMDALPLPPLPSGREDASSSSPSFSLAPPAVALPADVAAAGAPPVPGFQPTISRISRERLNIVSSLAWRVAKVRVCGDVVESALWASSPMVASASPAGW